MSTVKVTFVQAIFVMVTFLHIWGISHLSLTQFWPNFLNTIFAGLIFMDQNFQWTNFCLTKTCFGSKKFWTPNVVDSPFGDSKFCWTLIFLALTFFGPTFFGPTFCSNFILNSNINATTKQKQFNGFWHNWNQPSLITNMMIQC